MKEENHGTGDLWFRGIKGHSQRTERTDRALRASGRRMPKLAVILVGENPASLSYVTGKEKACTQVGMESELIKLPATTSQEELMAVVRRLNAGSERRRDFVPAAAAGRAGQRAGDP